ncbi:MAG: PKD domain-containing protein [Actinomycetes bacterium]
MGRRRGVVRRVVVVLAMAGGLTAALVAPVGTSPSEAAVTVWEGPVLGSADDAEESGTGNVDLTSSDLELVTDGAPQVVGLRFAGVAVPTGATITAAWVQFTADEVHSVATSLQIHAQNADTAATFASSTRNVSLRPRTVGVAWAPSPWSTAGAAGTAQRTPDLASVIQPVVDRTGWRSGNAIALVVTGTGRRAAESFDGNGPEPRLHVEYDGGGGSPPPNQPPVVSAGPDVTVTEPDPAVLAGSATDDGRPNPPGALQVSWTQVSGPSGMVFADPAAASTTATFPAPGTYVARLTATDTDLSVSDDTVVTVLGSGSGGSALSAEARVSGSADDAEQAGTSVDLTSSDLELVRDGVDQTVGLRFPALAVPRGARVTQAHVQFQVDEATTAAAALTLRAVASDNAPQFGPGSLSVTSRPLTAATASWAPAGWPTVGAAGPAQRTPDIAALVQEVLDRPGWQSGNALAVVLTGTGRRTAEAFDGNGAAPVLRLDYRTGPAGNAAPVVDAGSDRGGATGQAIALAGRVTDDGLPAGATVTSQWSVVSGPGTVSIQNPDAPATTATFSDAGTYVLRLIASDSELTSSDDVAVTAATPGTGVRFGAAGDHGARDEAAASLAALDSSGADFYLALGDLDYGHTPTDEAWCDFVISRLPTLGPTFPFEVLVGNNEQQGRSADGYILNHARCLPDRLGATLGPTNQYAAEYYVDYPPSAPLVRAILIAPRMTVENVTYDYAPGTVHHDWLVAAIDDARASGIPWVVVGMHYNCLSTGPHGCSSGEGVFNLLVGKKVDLVLQGHNHLYERSKQLALNPLTCPALSQNSYDADCVVDDGADGQYVKGAGTISIVAGAFGQGHPTPDMSQPDAPYFARIDATTFGFPLYDLTATRLQARFVPSIGTFTDAFDIVSP